MTTFASNSMSGRGPGSPIRRTLAVVPVNLPALSPLSARAVGLRGSEEATAVTPAGLRSALEFVEKVLTNWPFASSDLHLGSKSGARVGGPLSPEGRPRNRPEH